MADQKKAADWFPDKKELEEQYESYRPVFEAVLEGIETRLKNILILPSLPTCKSRIKTFKSYYRKLQRLRPVNRDDFPVLTDMIGIRVICAFLQDLAVVEKKITEHFKVIEIERKGADRTFREFGYESTHVLIEIPSDIRVPSAPPNGLVCEIQIRTILQDAWAEVEHELVYKSEFSPFDLPLKRKLASMNASLSLADIIFQEIRDYQTKLNGELDRRRDSFYDQADKLLKGQAPEVFKHDEISSDSLIPASPYIQGTIDDLLLEAIHAHNAGQLERAESIYTQILEAKPNDVILSVIYKHRGMAYFAQGKYPEALEDFKKSVTYNENNFRSDYYVGIVYGVMGDEHSAIDYYDKSLAKNSFQPHLYYRKALSLFHLGDYGQAMTELDKCASLGLENEDTAKLRKMLVRKLEMV